MVFSSIRLAPLEAPCAQHWDQQFASQALPSALISLHFFLNLLFPISCKILPAYQPYFLPIDLFFSISLLLKDHLLIPFSASRHTKKQAPCPTSCGRWGMKWTVLCEVAERRESPPTAGCTGSFPQEWSEFGRQVIWKAFLVTEPKFFGGLEVPMSSCSLCQKTNSSLIHGSWRYYYMLLINVATTVGGSSRQCYSPGLVFTSWPFVQEVLFLNVNHVLSNDSRD